MNWKNFAAGSFGTHHLTADGEYALAVAEAFHVADKYATQEKENKNG